MLRSRNYYWTLQGAYWVFMMVINAIISFIQGGTNESILYEIINSMIFAATGILFTHLYGKLAERKGWVNLPLDSQWIRLLSTVLLFSIVGGLIEIGITFVKMPHHATLKYASVLFFTNILYFLPWFLIYHIWMYHEKYVMAENDKLRLENTLKDMEMQVLKNQLNPHFLFNALNSLKALISENPVQARSAIVTLSDLLRSVLTASERDATCLKEEMRTVKDYLEIEKIRYEDRLEYDFNIQEYTYNLLLPPLVLLTLVENAIKHGVGKLEGLVRISINSNFQDNKWHLEVQNNAVLDPAKRLASKGIGLKNLKKRLELLYPGQIAFQIKEISPKFVSAVINIKNPNEKDPGYFDR